MKNTSLGFKTLCYTVVTTIMILASCRNGGNQTDQKTSAPIAKKLSDTIEISVKQVQTAGISIGSIEPKNLNTLVKATGQLVLPPSNQAMVSTVIAGTVKQILVKEGDRVWSGQIVAYIESPEFTRMQQEYLTTRANLVYVQQEYDRQKLLNDENAGTGKVFQQAKANLLTEQAKLAAMLTALKQLNINTKHLNSGRVSARMSLIAPLSGQVNHVNVTIGSPAEVNKPLLDVINGDGIYADLKIFEKDISQVKAGERVELALSGQNQPYISGTIYALNSVFESDNRVVIAHVRLNTDQTRHFIPGTYVTASVRVGNQTIAAVPEDAVVTTEGKQFIFLALGEGDEASAIDHSKKFNFKKAEVFTGPSDMGYVGIKLLTNLPTDVKVVTRGAKYILAESLKGDSDDNDTN